MRLIVILILMLALFGTALIFYLSWLPQPKLGLNWFIPDWLATWADARTNDTIRTAVPFVFLGILTGIWLTMVRYPWHSWFTSWLVLVVIVLVAELGQLLLPYRSFDWWDIIWAAIGAIIGLIMPFVSTKFIRFIKEL
ncbi:VanZ family protein [Adhaeribacter pallidiroseus]|uniref:VanZ-like domain-containing protein n=1 Tax=Adhaeribacter pallidiroseus TaxID=2072847 RepID=A0A369QP36_9BACT|nr:VanZ family protein [Adhaeribacter pallidiroseus]RDC66102.1 hypothetical protein AHMF7616_04733 [Adhaeribacter pallidiroseus]